MDNPPIRDKASTSFKVDLITEDDLEITFQKHIIEANSYFFKEILKKPEEEYNLRKDLSSILDINIRDIALVGSAKIGFSVKTHKFKEFDEEYQKTKELRKKSDIDIAIISESLYERLSDNLYKLTGHFNMSWLTQKWILNEYYPSPKLGDRPLYDKFFYYLAKGWYRPDMTPNEFQEPWASVAFHWRKKLDRKISIAVYRDWKFLKNYQIDHLKTIKAKVKELEV